jgi:uncharacterized protein (DUF983 family)
MTDPHPLDAPLRTWATGLAGRCPRCGRGALFAGVLKVADRCTACDLDLRGHDAGDGPAVFVILGLGAVMMILVFWVEFRFEPPWWLHVLLWLPLLLGASVGLLRLIKGWLVAQQFRHRADRMGGERS